MAPSYDFIIVGGGTAGLVVASRLSEDPAKSVLVLEAGSDLSDDARVNIPIFYAALLGSEADWNFHTTPQSGLGGRVIGLNQGKAVGGSSAINANVFVPPASDVINAWETLGNPGWEWDSFNFYFSKAYSSPEVTDDAKKALAIDVWPSLNSAEGPIKTSFGNNNHSIRAAWAETFREHGRLMPNDPFIHNSVGAFSCLASIDSKGVRSYAGSAYFQPAKQRENLKILTNAQVEKIIFDSSQGSPKAVGVQYSQDNATKVATANKEVILAAGAVQSPKLLELSGIGNADVLRKVGIDVVADLPGVGENLQDHLISYTAFHAADDIETKDALVRQEPEAIAQAMQEYIATQDGPLASLGVHTYAYLPLPAQDQEALKAELDQQEIPEDPRSQAYYELAKDTLLDPNQPSAAFMTAIGQTNYPKDLNNASATSEPSPGKFITFGAMLSAPLSRGSVHIASSKVQEPPVVDPGYLTNPLDLEVIARHLLRIKPLASSTPFQKLLKQPLAFRFPSEDFNGDLQAAKEYARANLGSMWHLAGTNSMLPREKGGVVDSRLKVYGVEGLRVVDASAIPLVSTANLQATVYAFAEKAADLIVGDWKKE
ncbi:hypothetical protein KVR01_011458 [Diaporthe batatas]|uniref:uncharacterized protein n=1 Tax=Diaporthe batatas TaxID=748121 RepID=UPI001D05194D|nr:uncharacterized protein KVR01_011458 [Diaporthe batatas]KAG8159015.1 hypothetical protein KVR01_011458 [Diaporthe batatas]